MFRADAAAPASLFICRTKVGDNTEGDCCWATAGTYSRACVVHSRASFSRSKRGNRLSFVSPPQGKARLLWQPAGSSARTHRYGHIHYLPTCRLGCQQGRAHLCVQCAVERLFLTSCDGSTVVIFLSCAGILIRTFLKYLTCVRAQMCCC
jgi:hypothetical protein